MTAPHDAARARRLAEIVGAVVRQALADHGAARVALLDDGSPEARLAAAWLGEALPARALVRVAPAAEALESVLQTAGASAGAEGAATEARRLWARLVPDSVAALPANKTALLLGGPLPPEPLLPLGDLFASEVAALAGGWSAPAPVREMAERAGGIDRLDDALRGRLDGRDPRGLERLPGDLGEAVRAALARGAASRLAPRIVPKIGYRTLGADLFE